jgi:hypothetical protein
VSLRLLLFLTLSPIIVRREFGAVSFGPVFGVASCAIQLVTALGPGLYGILHDSFGSYREPLLLAAMMDIIAAFVILRGRQKTQSSCRKDKRDRAWLLVS